MKNIFNYLFIAFLLFACKSNSQDKKNEKSGLNEQLTNMNRMMVENESKRIDDFIAAHNFKTVKTGTGLRYEIYKKGTGKKPENHSEVEIKFKVYLLNGTLCYSSDSLGTAKFTLGYDEQVRGLEEGLMLMVPGDKAHLIVPAHLAYGLSGDRNKITPGKALYYDVELIKIIK